jgi:hypothetical protein
MVEVGPAVKILRCAPFLGECGKVALSPPFQRGSEGFFKQRLINQLPAAKECHGDPVEKRGKQSQRLKAEIPGGTGILPVIPKRQAGSLSHR